MMACSGFSGLSYWLTPWGGVGVSHINSPFLSVSTLTRHRDAVPLREAWTASHVMLGSARLIEEKSI